MNPDTDSWCACGNRLSACIGTRRGCRHMSPRCRSITGAVNDDYCDWCRREQALLAKLEEHISALECIAKAKGGGGG